MTKILEKVHPLWRTFSLCGGDYETVLSFHLSPFMIYCIPIFHNQRRNRNQSIPLLFQNSNHLIQCFCRVFGTVVAENDGTVAEVFMFGDFFDYGGGVVVFPVERVHIRYS